MDFFAVFYSFFAGLAAGVLGALPFLHTNTLLAAFGASASVFPRGGIEPVAASVFAVALSFSHLAFETIPALFLAIPAQNQSIAALPAQRLVLRGEAERALLLIARSLLLALLASIALAPLALVLLPIAFAAVKPLAGWALLAIVALALAREKTFRRALLAAGVFVLCGAVGFVALSLPIAAEPLFPLLGGLFGVPALLFSFGAKPKKLSEGGSRGAGGAGVAAGGGASSGAAAGARLAPVDSRLVLACVGVGAASVLFPALSPALLCGALFFFLEGEGDAERFIEASSALVASKMFFDFAGVFAIGKARSGAAALVLESFVSERASASLADFALVSVACLAALAAALALLVVFRKRFASAFSRISGNAFSASLLALLAVGAFVVSGFGGILVLAAAAAAGCVAPLLGLKRSFAMGALFVPSLAFFFGFAAPLAQLFY